MYPVQVTKTPNTVTIKPYYSPNENNTYVYQKPNTYIGNVNPNSNSLSVYQFTKGMNVSYSSINQNGVETSIVAPTQGNYNSFLDIQGTMNKDKTFTNTTPNGFTFKSINPETNEGFKLTVETDSTDLTSILQESLIKLPAGDTLSNAFRIVQISPEEGERINQQMLTYKGAENSFISKNSSIVTANEEALVVSVSGITEYPNITAVFQEGNKLVEEGKIKGSVVNLSNPITPPNKSDAEFMGVSNIINPSMSEQKQSINKQNEQDTQKQNVQSIQKQNNQSTPKVQSNPKPEVQSNPKPEVQSLPETTITKNTKSTHSMNKYIILGGGIVVVVLLVVLVYISTSRRKGKHGKH